MIVTVTATIPREAISVIDRQGGQIVFECDSCDETLETGTAEFRDAWSLAKREGWRSKKLVKCLDTCVSGM